MTTSADLAALTDQLYNRYVPLSDVTSSLKVLGIGSVNDLLARIKKETGKSFEAVSKEIRDANGTDLIDTALTLEPVYKPKLNPMNMYVMDQVMFDSLMFNENAWKNALKHMSAADADALVIFNALTRVDRPEFKSDDFSNYEPDLDDDESAEYDPIWHEVEREFLEVEKRFKEAREALPDAEIVYVWSMDDGFTANRFHHYFSVKYRNELKENIKGLKDTVKILERERTDLEKNRESKKRKRESLRERATELKQHSSSLTGDELEEYTRLMVEVKDSSKLIIKYTHDIECIDRKLEGREKSEKYRGTHGLKRKLEDALEDDKTYMVRKENPVHQHLQVKAFRLIADKYSEICRKYKIRFIGAGLNQPDSTLEDSVDSNVVKINGNKIKLVHNARAKDMPVRNRHKELEHALQAKVDRYVEEGIYLIVEGNHGLGSFEKYRTAITQEEITNVNDGKFFPAEGTYGNNVYVAVAPQFMNQEVLKAIIDGRYGDRFTGRKTTGNRSHYVVEQYNNGAVSGLQRIVVDREGKAGHSIISFDRLKESSDIVKDTIPNRFYVISIQGDIHIGLFQAIELIYGAQARRHRKLDNAGEFNGIPLQFAGLIEVGDTIEGGTAGWNGAGAEHRRNSVFEEIDSSIQWAMYNPESIDEYIELFAEQMRPRLQGPDENIEDLMRMASDHYKIDVARYAEKSPLNTVFVAVKSNHFFSGIRSQGFTPFGTLEAVLDALGLHNRINVDRRAARSNAFGQSDYGLTTEGNALFGPFGLYVVHDPQYRNNIVSTAIKAGLPVNARLAAIGHYHKFAVGSTRYMDRPNELTLGIAGSSLQRVTSTELYKGGTNRNHGTQELYIGQGDTDLSTAIVFDVNTDLLTHEAKRSLRLELKEGLFRRGYTTQ